MTRRWGVFLCLTALAVVQAVRLQAQATPLSFGIAAAINHTRFDRDAVDGRPGWSAGVTGTLALSAALNLRADGQLTRKSFRYQTGGCPFFFGCTPEQLVPPSTATTSLTRLDFPLQLEWHPAGNGARPFLRLGPFASVHLQCRGRLESIGQSSSYSCGDGFHPVSFGAVADAGVLTERLAFGARLIRDLGDLTGPVPADGSSIFTGARVTTLALFVEIRNVLR